VGILTQCQVQSFSPAECMQRLIRPF
jgi:hypothetical protein